MPQDIGIIGPLSSMDFVGERTGWAVGAIGTILHTADGGLAWDQQLTGLASLSAVDFVDTENGWAVCSGLFEGRVILSYCEGS